jgi:hypothetical protein
MINFYIALRIMCSFVLKTATDSINVQSRILPKNSFIGYKFHNSLYSNSAQFNCFQRQLLLLPYKIVPGKVSTVYDIVKKSTGTSRRCVQLRTPFPKPRCGRWSRVLFVRVVLTLVAFSYPAYSFPSIILGSRIPQLDIYNQTWIVWYEIYVGIGISAFIVG